MEGQWTFLRLLCPAMLICLLAFATADEQIQTCANGDSSACVQRRAQSLVFSNYAPDTDEDEQENENDADLTMHMQTRVNINSPMDSPDRPAQAPEGAAPIESGSPAGQQQALSAAPPVVAASSLLQEDSAVGPAPEATSPDVVITGESHHETYRGDAGVFITGYQLLLGAGVGALLVITGAVLATFFRTWMTDRKGTSRDEMKAAGKAWILDWALGYDPDTDEEPVPRQADVKMQRLGKKMPPMPTDSDSGDTDEEEPEAESGNDEVELLEDAVFVAEQVEVANEAADRGYGIDERSKLADLIR